MKNNDFFTQKMIRANIHTLIPFSFQQTPSGFKNLLKK